MKVLKIYKWIGMVALSFSVFASNVQASIFDVTVRVELLSDIGSDVYNASVAVAMFNKYGEEYPQAVGDTINVQVFYPRPVFPPPGEDFERSQDGSIKTSSNVLKERNGIVPLNKLSSVLNLLEDFENTKNFDDFVTNVVYSIGQVLGGLTAMTCTAVADNATSANNCVDIAETMLDIDLNGDGYVGKPPANNDGSGGNSGGGNSGSSGGAHGSRTFTWWTCSTSAGGGGSTTTCVKHTATITY